MVEMNGYTQARCLFCKTGKEARVVHMIHENGWGRAIFAQRVRYVKRSGEWKQLESPLLPSYVFVYLTSESFENKDFYRIPHVLRVLRYESGF